jgi:hypothetical protein
LFHQAPSSREFRIHKICVQAASVFAPGGPSVGQRVLFDAIAVFGKRQISCDETHQHYLIVGHKPDEKARVLGLMIQYLLAPVQIYVFRDLDLIRHIWRTQIRANSIYSIRDGADHAVSM